MEFRAVLNPGPSKESLAVCQSGARPLQGGRRYYADLEN